MKARKSVALGTNTMSKGYPRSSVEFHQLEHFDNMNGFPPWLYESQIESEGDPALYPYAQLRNILKPEDVRIAIKDECGPLESEFGIHLVEPFYRLLWLMNTLPAFFTTHVNVAPPDY